MSRISVKGRIAGTLAAAAALGGLGAGTAHAVTTPGIANDVSRAVVAIETPAYGLQLYWQANGTVPWHAETVAGPGTTFSAPTVTQAVTQGTSQVVIAAAGAGQSLRAYNSNSITGPFLPEIVDGPGTAVDAPSVASDGNLVLLASEATGGRMNFYWTNVLPLWHPETVVASGATSGPSLSVNPGVSPSRINVVFRGGLSAVALAVLVGARQCRIAVTVVPSR